MTDNEAQLRALFAHMDPVPQLLDEAARAAFTWRTVDEELAELTRDSSEEEAGAVLMRSGAAGPRQLSFESPRLSIEVEVVATGPRERRLAGQLLPPEPATVSVERPGEEELVVQADELGRFTLEGLRAGVIRLRVAQIAIPWVSI